MIHGCKKGKQMKHKLLMLSLLTLASAAAWAVPDLKNPALTPVRFEPAPNHAPLKLIEKGKPNFAIVYDKSNRDRAFTSSVERAALLLEEAVEKCTGVKPAVLGLHEQDKAKQYQYKIHLGYNDITKKLGADPFKGPKQGYQLFTCPEGVVIAGYDSALLDQGKKYSRLEPRDILRGTLWGACDFAERILGCRWYFPGEYGSIFPKIAELTLPAVRYSDYPRFYNRDGCWIGWSLRGKKKQWEALMGAYQKETDSPNRLMTMQEYWRLEPFMGPKSFHPGHDPEPSRIMKFYPDRKKDIFFTDESGYMRYNPKAHIGNDFDLTNLKFADIIIDAMKKYYASGGKDYNIWSYPPNKQYINIGQCDGEVPDMDMLRNPTVQKLKLISQADIDSGVAQRNVYGRFLQYFATRVKEEFPGLRVAFMPYQGGTYAPTDPRWKLPDNIDLRVCTHIFPRAPRNPKKIAKTMQCLKEWYEATGNRPIDSLWFYHIPAESGSPFLRAIAAQFVGESINVCGKLLGRTNIFFDQYGGLNWSYYYSEYCGAKAFWNPDFNADAAVDEHWEPFYGKEAGAELKKFHRLMKDSYINLYMMNDAENSINPLYPPQVIDQLEACLNKAASHIRPGTVEAKRFALFSMPWKDAILSQRNRQSYIRPNYNVYRLLSRDKVELDGKGNEAFWKNLKPIAMQDPKGSGARPKYPYSVKLAWDDNGIYGLLEAPCRPLADAGKDLWHNDSCEIFIAPGVNRREDFYHFAVDALGNQCTGFRKMFPIATPYGRHDAPGFRRAVVRNDNSWSMEFFIPFADMKVKAPRPYDVWGANIVSNKLGEPQEYMSSALTLADNHNLEMFGTIKFLGKGD